MTHRSSTCIAEDSLIRQAGCPNVEECQGREAEVGVCWSTLLEEGGVGMEEAVSAGETGNRDNI